MRTSSLLLAAAVASLGLTACNKTGTAAGSRICTPFPEAAGANAPSAAVPNPTDPAAALDDCLHRWGYTLAASTDRAPDVAQASVAACMPALARWNQAGLAAGAAGPEPGAAPTAPSLLNGQPTTPMAEHYAYAQGRALFYVVQARAGKCAPPPAATASNAAPANR